MPFNTLILVCPNPSKTQFTESGSKVHMERKEAETVLFFDISQQAQHSSILRKDWEIANDKPLCDLIVFYSQKYDQNNDKVICFVESKGGKVIHAVEQIITTYEAMNKQLNLSLKSKNNLKIKWKAYVRQHGASPQDNKQAAQKLESKFGKGNFAIRNNNDLGEFLRKS